MPPLQIIVRRLKKSLSRAISFTSDKLLARVLGLAIGIGIGKAFTVLVLGIG